MLRCLPLLALGLAVLSGCQGSGHIDVAALNYNAIDPPAPRISRLNLQRCYWWTDDEGRVWIAMERDQPLVIRPEHFVFQLSLVLDKLPAGRARDYHISRHELRGVARLGPAESRLVSIAGIMALYREPGDRLRGSLRLLVARHGRELLGNWGPASRYLLLGSFEAVHDEQRGRRIAEATEASGWGRQPPSETQPASRPTSTTAPAPATPLGNTPPS